MVAIIFMIVIGVLGILMGFGLFELAADHDRTFMIWSHEWVQRFDSLYLAKADAAASLSDQPHSTLWDPWLLIVIYQTPEVGNILEAKNLKRIQAFEAELVDSPDFQQYCVISDTQPCDSSSYSLFSTGFYGVDLNDPVQITTRAALLAETDATQLFGT